MAACLPDLGNNKKVATTPPAQTLNLGEQPMKPKNMKMKGAVGKDRVYTCHSHCLWRKTMLTDILFHRFPSKETSWTRLRWGKERNFIYHTHTGLLSAKDNRTTYFVFLRAREQRETKCYGVFMKIIHVFVSSIIFMNS